MTKELVFSVTLDDCDVQAFSVSKGGGQRRDKKATGVRIVHRASGAVGMSQDERSQLQNKRTAFKRMAATNTFTVWLHAVTHGLKTPSEIEEEVLTSLSDPANLKVEVKDGKQWVETDSI